MRMASNKRKTIPSRQVLRDPVCLLAFGFGSGLAPKAPGTAGTLAAIPLVLLASQLPLAGYWMLTLLMFLAGIWICGQCERILEVEDHSGIVWDEFVGLFIAMAGAPVSLPAAISGFLLFRLFDVWKPWPIGWLDRRIHGGLGIMLDDAVAGVYAWLCLYGLLHNGWV